MQRIAWLLAAGMVIGTTACALAEDIPSLEVLYKGTSQSPPTSGPKPEPGKKVWIIPCGQELVSCSIPADAMVEAAKLIGWTATIFDGKLDPAVAGAGVRQAIAGKYDAIALYAVDCNGIKQPLIEAKKAGIKIVAAESLDCNETDASDKSLFDSSVAYVEGSLAVWDKEWGRWQAYYVIDKLDGKADAINFYTDEQQTTLISSDGIKDAFTKCKGCTLHDVKFSFASLGPQLQQQAQQTFLRFPKVNAAIVPSDGVILGGVGPAAAASARKLLMMGCEGQAENMELVRQGGKQQAAGIGIPGRWEAYAEIDDLNRVFHGQKGEVSGIGLQAYDADHNMPKTGAYVPPIDFVAVYKKSWGVTQ